MSDVQRRLLDLLAGWEAYVSKCAESEEPHPGVTREQYLAEAAAIAKVHQQVGAIDHPNADNIALSYVSTDIIGILMRGDALAKEAAEECMLRAFVAPQSRCGRQHACLGCVDCSALACEGCGATQRHGMVQHHPKCWKHWMESYHRSLKANDELREQLKKMSPSGTDESGSSDLVPSGAGAPREVAPVTEGAGTAPVDVAGAAGLTVTRRIWRVGHKVGKTLYEGDEFIGHVDSEEHAGLIVDAVNQYLPNWDEDDRLCSTTEHRAMHRALREILDITEHGSKVFEIAAAALPPPKDFGVEDERLTRKSPT